MNRSELELRSDVKITATRMQYTTRGDPTMYPHTKFGIPNLGAQDTIYGRTDWLTVQVAIFGGITCFVILVQAYILQQFYRTQIGLSLDWFQSETLNYPKKVFIFWSSTFIFMKIIFFLKNASFDSCDRMKHMICMATS